MANNENLKPFKPGHDERRNLEGRPKLPDLSDLIYEEVGDKGFREAISALLKQAKKGNVKAIQELLDRGYGKTIQKTELSGADGGPIVWQEVKTYANPGGEPDS